MHFLKLEEAVSAEACSVMTSLYGLHESSILRQFPRNREKEDTNTK